MLEKFDRIIAEESKEDEWVDGGVSNGDNLQE